MSKQTTDTTAALPANVDTLHRIDRAKVGANAEDLATLQKMRTETGKGYGPNLAALLAIEKRGTLATFPTLAIGERGYFLGRAVIRDTRTRYRTVVTHPGDAPEVRGKTQTKAGLIADFDAGLYHAPHLCARCRCRLAQPVGLCDKCVAEPARKDESEGLKIEARHVMRGDWVTFFPQVNATPRVVEEVTTKGDRCILVTRAVGDHVGDFSEMPLHFGTHLEVYRRAVTFYRESARFFKVGDWVHSGNPEEPTDRIVNPDNWHKVESVGGEKPYVVCRLRWQSMLARFDAFEVFAIARPQCNNAADA